MCEFLAINLSQSHANAKLRPLDQRISKVSLSQQAQYISTDSALAEFVSSLRAQNVEWIAIDTEFVRRDTYFAELSLVQISTPDLQMAIIDPVVEGNGAIQLDLSPLKSLLCDESICKVFHSARQDIEVLSQTLGEVPKNIFDTQIAAILNKHGDLAGFARVVAAELGVELEKSQTRTNWHARPLTEKQIEYALDDVYYLAKIYAKWLESMPEDWLAAAKVDSEKFLDAELYFIDPQSAWTKIKQIKNLKPKQLAVVKALAAWREEDAIRSNHPKKWVIADDVIVAIAKRPPKTAQALYKVPGIKSSSVKGFGEEWIALIDDVFAQDPESYPQKPEKMPPADPFELIQIELMHLWSLQVANEYQLNWQNLTSKDSLLKFMRAEESARNTDPFDGWRHYLFYADAFALLNGEKRLEMDKKTNSLKCLS